MIDFPTISIITVVRNCEKTIETTILSVLDLEYKNIEYIIIDGKSTDGTLKIINKYEDKIDYFISESDLGIYDAMNKGVRFSSGDWVSFMNAGDIFYKKNTINQIFDKIENNDFDVVYGDFIAVDEKNKNEIKIKAKPIHEIWSGMIFSHQSVFIKSEVIKNFPFDLSFKIAADFNQILMLFVKEYKFFNTNQVISKTTIDGVSYSNLATLKENIKIVKRYKDDKTVVKLYIKIYVVTLLKFFLGKNLSSFLRKIKWSFK